MIETYQAFIKHAIEEQIKRVYQAIEPEYSKLGTLSIVVHPPKKKVNEAILIIKPHRKKLDEPPYDNLEGDLFISLREDYSFVLDAGLALTSGGEWGKEIADIDIQFTSDTDPRKTIQELLEAVSDKMIKEFHGLLPEINGNLWEWILERERKD